MPYFRVWIEEHLQNRALVIKAVDAEEAREKYQEAWENGDIDVVKSHEDIDWIEIIQPEKWDELLTDWLMRNTAQKLKENQEDNN